MNQSLETLINDFEVQKDNFTNYIQGFSAAELAQKPSEGWNMLQVMEHVIWSEKGTLEYLKRKTQAPWTAIEIASDEEVKQSSNLNSALKSEKRWRAPEVLPEPSGAQSLENMLAYWDELRNEYLAFTEGLDENYYNRLVFKHPFSGRLNLFQTIEFLSNHIIHHVHQLKRIAEAIK